MVSSEISPTASLGADQTHTLTFVFNKNTGDLNADEIDLILDFSSVLLTVA